MGDDEFKSLSRQAINSSSVFSSSSLVFCLDIFLHRYPRALDSSSADTSEDVVRDFLQQETGHLTPLQLNYFSHWLLLCCLEAATMEAKNGRKRVWLQTVEERYEA